MKMRKLAIVMFLVQSSICVVSAATYTSNSSGTWISATTWSPNIAGGPTIDDIVIINHTITRGATSLTGWTGSASITINSGGALNFSGNVNWTGSGVNIYVQTGGTLAVTGTLTLDNSAEIIMQGGTLTASGAFALTGGIYSATSGSSTSVASLTTSSSGSTSFNNTGVFNVSGNVSASGIIQLNPGTNSIMTITGTLTVNANPNVVVGTNVSACNTAITNYANLIVKTNLVVIGSGDVTVNQNGRLVVFGNLTSSGGSGNLITINCGAQAYVNGYIDLGTGGGNTVTNSNSGSSPTGSNGSPVIGLYVNGTTTAQNISGTVGNKSTLQSNDLTFYNYIASLSGSPLPITLSYFKVSEVTSEAVTLVWATASEINFDHFNLQRSTDGKIFKTIGTIKGNGTTKERHDYSFPDKLPVNGTAYYRLQSVDFDQYTETFSVITVTFESAHDVVLYPVPVTNSNLSFHLNFEPKTEILVFVLSASGMERIRGIIKANETDVNLGLSLEPGVYIVKMNSIDFNKVSRITVQ